MQLLQQRSTAPSRQGLHVCNVAVPSKPPAFKAPRRSKVEIIKEKSDYLRHPLMEELVNENPNINEDAMQLMKFHGSYMQVCTCSCVNMAVLCCSEGRIEGHVGHSVASNQRV
jgi:hypothetical protein